MSTTTTVKHYRLFRMLIIHIRGTVLCIRFKIDASSKLCVRFTTFLRIWNMHKTKAIPYNSVQRYKPLDDLMIGWFKKIVNRNNKIIARKTFRIFENILSKTLRYTWALKFSKWEFESSLKTKIYIANRNNVFISIIISTS